MLQNLLELFKGFKEGKLNNLNLFSLRDSKVFLEKVYANIFFTGINKKSSRINPKNYELEVKYVRAKEVYKDYLKALTRSYKELEEFNGKKISKDITLSEIELYEKLLEEVLKGDPYIDFNWKMRNSLIHNHIESNGNLIKFYITGKNLKLNHFNKKTKVWELKDFENKKVIWEMVCTNEELIRMLDEMFEENNIVISVNISKYVKRKDYLK